MSDFLIQSRFGRRGNFELVAPTLAVPGNVPGIAHFWRNNDDPNLPWRRSPTFGTGLRNRVQGVALIQSNFGSPGNLEVVAQQGGNLYHFWRDSGPQFQWRGPQLISSGVIGTPSLIQSRFGRRGNFELVVPLSLGGIAHFWRDNDDPNLPWRRSPTFGTALPGQVSAVTIIQSNFGSPGNLEVVAQQGGDLYHFWRDSGPQFQWRGPQLISSGVIGTPSLIQSRFGRQGNFELVVPLSLGGIAHFWRDNDDSNLPWRHSATFGGVELVDAVSLIQSNFGSPGNLEVVARLGGRLVHYWRDSGPQFQWRGPNGIGVAYD